MKNNKVYFNLFLIILAGFLFRITSIDKVEGLWNDEYISWYISSKPLISDFVQSVYKNCHMPFYYLYLKIISNIFGNEDIILRFSSVIPNIIGIIVMFFIGKNVKDEKTGLLCAGITAVSGFMIYFSQEVRFYSILFLFSSFSLLFSLRLMNKQSYLNFLGFYIFNLMVMFTHTIGFVFVFFNFLYTFFFLKKQNHISNKQICYIVFATFFAMAPFFPFLYKTLTASYISQFWSDFSITKLFFVLADYVSPIQINIINTPLQIKTFLFKNGNYNWGYIIFAVVPLCIAGISALVSIFKRNTKLTLITLIGLSTLLVMIMASLFGKMVLITKYTVEFYPIFVLLVAYGFSNLKPNFLKKIFIFSFFTISLFYLLVSDYAPQKIGRPEGHKLVANLINNAQLNENDKILLLYYDESRFGKYIPVEKYFSESITKYNFQYRLLHNPPTHEEVINTGKDIFFDSFKNGQNLFFDNYLNNTFFKKMRKGQKFALISLTSVSFIDNDRMKKITSDTKLYQRMPFLFLIFSHLSNDTKSEADKKLKNIFSEKQGSWEITVWEKI